MGMYSLKFKMSSGTYRGLAGIHKILFEMLQEISIEYNLNFVDLQNKYLNTNLKSQNIVDNIDLSTNTKCNALTKNGQQCSRKKQKGENFCGSHLHNQPYGSLSLQQGNNKKNIVDKCKKESVEDGESGEDGEGREDVEEVSIEIIDKISYLISNGKIYKIPVDIDLMNNKELNNICIKDLDCVGEKKGDKYNFFTHSHKIWS